MKQLRAQHTRMLLNAFTPTMPPTMTHICAKPRPPGNPHGVALLRLHQHQRRHVLPQPCRRQQVRRHQTGARVRQAAEHFQLGTAGVFASAQGWLQRWLE